MAGFCGAEQRDKTRGTMPPRADALYVKGAALEARAGKEWWTAKAHKTSKDGVVRVHYTNSSDALDEAMPQESPRIRAADVQRSKGQDQKESRAADAADPGIPWVEFEEARKSANPPKGAAAAGGALAQLKDSVRSRLLELEEFQSSSASFPAMADVPSLLGELRRHKRGTGISFLAGEDGAVPTSVQASGFTLTRVLQGWKRCLDDASFDPRAVQEPVFSAVIVRLAARKGEQGAGTQADAVFDPATTTASMSRYLTGDPLRFWSLQHRGPEGPSVQGIDAQLEDLISNLFLWELAHCNVNHVALAVFPWRKHFGDLPGGGGGCVPGSCEGGVDCGHLGALDRLFQVARGKRLVTVAAGWFEGAGCGAKGHVSAASAAALWWRCSASVRTRLKLQCPLHKFFSSPSDRIALRAAFADGLAVAAECRAPGGAAWNDSHPSDFADTMHADHAARSRIALQPFPSIEKAQLRAVPSARAFLLSHRGVATFPRLDVLTTDSERYKACAMMFTSYRVGAHVYESYNCGRASADVYEGAAGG